LVPLLVSSALVMEVLAVCCHQFVCYYSYKIPSELSEYIMELILDAIPNLV
jgi:hypothetical protein